MLGQKLNMEAAVPYPNVEPPVTSVYYIDFTILQAEYAV